MVAGDGMDYMKEEYTHSSGIMVNQITKGVMSIVLRPFPLLRGHGMTSIVLQQPVMYVSGELESAFQVSTGFLS